MFSGTHAYIYRSSTTDITKSLLQQHGATLALAHTDPDLNLIVAASISHSPPDLPEFRRRKIAVVFPAFVIDSAECGSLIPLTSSKHTLFNPNMFSGIVATTSQLPQHVRKNVCAALEYFGGKYTAQLTRDCTMIIAHDDDMTFSTEKMRIGRANNIRCESVQWMQRSIDRGLLCCSTGSHATDMMLDVIVDEPPPVVPSRSPENAEYLSAAESSPGTRELCTDDASIRKKDRHESRRTAESRAPDHSAASGTTTINIASPSRFKTLDQLDATFTRQQKNLTFRKRPRDHSVTQMCHVDLSCEELQLRSASSSNRTIVTRSLAREMERKAAVSNAINSGPITRSKALVLERLLNRLSPQKVLPSCGLST